MFGFIPIPSRWAPRDEGAVRNATICDGRRNEKKRRSPSSPVGPAPSLLQVSRDIRGAIFDLPKSPSVSLTPGKAAFLCDTLQTRAWTRINRQACGFAPAATLDFTSAAGTRPKLIPGTAPRGERGGPSKAPQPFREVIPVINTF